ncbi:MAG: hypothetical protein K9J13_12105, partial [Saprospiraceae bacterium]|nr:hypothetical protein [Saprospiraceae bacterium]
MVYNKSAHIQIERKQEERGALQTLNNLPLRSRLFNAGVSTIKNSQPAQSERSFNNAFTVYSQIGNRGL